MRRMRRVGVLVLVATLYLSTTGCDGGDVISSTVNEEVAVVDQLINTLNGNSAIWEYELNQTLGSLNQTMNDLHDKLRDLIRDAEETAGKVTQCAAGYVGNLVVSELQGVKDDLLHKPRSAPLPMVCNTSPFELDPTSLVAKPVTVTYYGFNINPAVLHESLVHTDGSTVDVGAKLFSDSVFSDHIDLGGQNGVPVTTRDARLDLISSVGTYSVTFNPPGVPMCQQTNRPIDPAPKPVEFYPPRVGGDADWGGHGPHVTISARTVWSQHAIVVLVSFSAEETSGDHSKIAMTDVPYTLYTAPSGFTILPPPSGLVLADSVTYTHTGGQVEKPIERGDQSLISSYQVDFGQGAKAADSTALLVSFNQKLISLFGPPSGSQNCSNQPPLPPVPTSPPRPPKPDDIPSPPVCAKPVVPRNWCN